MGLLVVILGATYSDGEVVGESRCRDAQVHVTSLAPVIGEGGLSIENLRGSWISLRSLSLYARMQGQRTLNGGLKAGWKPVAQISMSISCS